MPSIFRSISFNILFYLNIFSAILLIACYFAPFISPAKNSWLAILALTYPLLLLLNLCWFLFWLYHRSRAIYLSLIAVLLGYSHIVALIGLSKEGDIPGNSLRIMSYNVRYFNTSLYTKEEKQLKSQLKILEYIQQQQPDILFGQEFSGKGAASSGRADALLENAGLQYRYRGGKSSLAIYSRFPILDKGVLNFQGSANGAIYADISTDKGIIRAYSVHLQSTRLGSDAEEVLKKDNLKNINKKETQEKYYRIEDKLSGAFAMRAMQAEILSEHIASSPYPVVVCGDFNDTPISYTYRLMSIGLQDAFNQKGWGLGSTYAGTLPALRIDYIMADNHFEIHSYKRQQKAISDHYAIQCEISLPERSKTK